MNHGDVGNELSPRLCLYGLSCNRLICLWNKQPRFWCHTVVAFLALCRWPSQSLQQFRNHPTCHTDNQAEDPVSSSSQSRQPKLWRLWLHRARFLPLSQSGWASLQWHQYACGLRLTLQILPKQWQLHRKGKSFWAIVSLFRILISYCIAILVLEF